MLGNHTEKSADTDENGALRQIEEALAALRRGGRPAKQRHGKGGHNFGHAAKFRALGALTQQEYSTVGELAELIGVDQPRASRLVISLEQQMLLNKKQDPRDARRTVISITAKGREFIAEVNERRRQSILRGLSSFSESETRQFAELLSRFVTDWSQE